MTTSDEAPPETLPRGNPRVAEDRRALSRIVFHALSSGACAVVPVPLLDDHLVKLTRRRMVREQVGRHGLELSSEDVAVLSGTEGRRWGWGCALGFAFSLTFKIVIKLLRRIFRTLLFWLLVKDVADAASRTVHEGYLVHRVLGRRSQDGPSVREMRGLVDAVLERSDTRALSHAFRGVLAGSRRALTGIARGLSRLVGLRREADAGEERLERTLESSIPDSLVERAVTRVLQSEALRRLDELLAEEVWRRSSSTSPDYS